MTELLPGRHARMAARPTLRRAPPVARRAREHAADRDAREHAVAPRVLGRCTLAVLALALAALGRGAAAQEPLVLGPLPDSAAERVLWVYNRAGTIRLQGESEIPGGTRIEGALAVLNGPLRIAGIVAGDVVVINGDAALAPGANVRGSITVTGGQVVLEPGAQVAGPVVSYREPLRFRYADDRLLYVPPHLEQGLSAGRDWRFGRADVFIGARAGYNRVEGLPVAVGPRLRVGGGNPTRLHALAIFRTAAGFGLDSDRMGYDVGGERRLGGSGLVLAAQLYSDIVSIEPWQITERENSLSTFLLHNDHRDHYQRAGGRVALRLERAELPLGGELWYRREDHTSVRPREPFTLFDESDPWRAEPRVAEGRLHAIGLDLRYDTRNEPDDPSYGWFLQGGLEQGIGGALTIPGADPAGRGTARTGFTEARLDLRRYSRISPYALFGFRVLAAGSADGRPLPPQRQHALGGEGSLPAFGLMRFDCGARDRAPADDQAFLPYYGCDRMALVQLEYQASFPLARRLGDRLGLGSSFTNSVRWVAFFDAGRAWTEPDARHGRGGGSVDFSADAGIGIRIAGLGAYWAIPLSGGGRPVNFFVRLNSQL